MFLFLFFMQARSGLQTVGLGYAGLDYAGLYYVGLYYVGSEEAVSP